jgi:hypothetical protein
MTTPKTPNNPPAFPTHHNVHDPRSDGFLSESGMTLRDWFAGMALQGLCSSGRASEYKTSEISDAAYSLADSMLAEREKGTQ